MDKNYMAVKVDIVSQVKKLFINHYSYENAGGSWELIAVTEEDNCVLLNQEAV